MAFSGPAFQRPAASGDRSASRRNYRELWADRADRKGFLLLGTAMNLKEGQWHRPGYQELWRKKLKQDLRRYRNHPSIVIWTKNPNWLGHGLDQGPRYVGRNREIAGAMSGWAAIGGAPPPPGGLILIGREAFSGGQPFPFDQERDRASGRAGFRLYSETGIASRAVGPPGGQPPCAQSVSRRARSPPAAWLGRQRPGRLGRLILSTLDLEDHVPLDAAAALLARNLIEYAATSPAIPRARRTIVMHAAGPKATLDGLGLLLVRQSSCSSATASQTRERDPGGIRLSGTASGCGSIGSRTRGNCALRFPGTLPGLETPGPSGRSTSAARPALPGILPGLEPSGRSRR